MLEYVAGVGMLVGVIVIIGRGGWSTWRFLECTGSACDAWAWYVGIRGVFWNVAGVLLMLGRGGCGTWRGVECTCNLTFASRIYRNGGSPHRLYQLSPSRKTRLK